MVVIPWFLFRDGYPPVALFPLWSLMVVACRMTVVLPSLNRAFLHHGLAFGPRVDRSRELPWMTEALVHGLEYVDSGRRGREGHGRGSDGAHGASEHQQRSQKADVDGLAGVTRAIFQHCERCLTGDAQGVSSGS